MTSPITIDSATLNTLVSKAILEGLGQDQRDILITQALDHLMTPPAKRSHYDPEPQTPLQDAFDYAVSAAAQKAMRELVEESPELNTRIREWVGEALTAALNGDETWNIRGKIGSALGQVFGDALRDR